MLTHLLTYDIISYKLSFAKDHKKSLFAVCKKHSHPQITREIRMELSTKAGARALGAQDMSVGEDNRDNNAMDDDDEEEE